MAGIRALYRLIPGINWLYSGFGSGIPRADTEKVTAATPFFPFIGEIVGWPIDKF
jgi:hypothetical protein